MFLSSIAVSVGIVEFWFFWLPNLDLITEDVDGFELMYSVSVNSCCSCRNYSMLSSCVVV